MSITAAWMGQKCATVGINRKSQPELSWKVSVCANRPWSGQELVYSSLGNRLASPQITPCDFDMLWLSFKNWFSMHFLDDFL